jgi:serine/threonine-protein kinase
MTLQPGSRLGKYVVRKRLGAGGMGEVYSAIESSLGGKVAIKIIGRDNATDRVYMARFRREAEAISVINHPHIVKLFEFVEADPDKQQPAYMVMEFLPGRDLGAVIKEGPLEISRGVGRILESCAAVAEAHRYGYIHRDLKPPNIFLAEYDQIEMAKVLDFGAAKATDTVPRAPTATEHSELTRKNTIFGTPSYMAPEQLQGGRITPKVDQYALGIALYAAVTGVKPFEQDNKRTPLRDLELVKAITSGEHVKARARRPEIPEGLEAIIEQMMHLDPDKRFTDLHAAGAALRPFASEVDKMRWEAHFTTKQPTHRNPQVSVAISDSDMVSESGRTQHLYDPTSVDDGSASASASHKLGSMPTVRSAPDPNQLASVVGDIHVRTTVEQEATPIRRAKAEYVPISIEEASRSSAGSTPVTRPRGASNERRRAGLILAGLVAAVSLALVVAFSMSRSKPSHASAPSPPPELLARPAAGPTAPAAAPIPPPAPTSAPVVAPAVAPVPAEQTQVSAPAPAKHPHHHRKLPSVDEHGVGIPSD